MSVVAGATPESVSAGAKEGASDKLLALLTEGKGEVLWTFKNSMGVELRMLELLEKDFPLTIPLDNAVGVPHDARLCLQTTIGRRKTTAANARSRLAYR